MANSPIEMIPQHMKCSRLEPGQTAVIEFSSYQTAAHIMCGVSDADFCDILFSDGYLKQTAQTNYLPVTFDRTTWRKITIKNNHSTGVGYIFIANASSSVNVTVSIN